MKITTIPLPNMYGPSQRNRVGQVDRIVRNYKINNFIGNKKSCIGQQQRRLRRLFQKSYLHQNCLMSCLYSHSLQICPVCLRQRPQGVKWSLSSVSLLLWRWWYERGPASLYSLSWFRGQTRRSRYSASSNVCDLHNISWNLRGRRCPL